MSRDKGARAERAVAKIFQKFGFDVNRTANSGAVQKWGGHPGDLMGVDNWHIEVKHQEVIKILDWMHQAEEEARDGDEPILIFRKNGEKWRVVFDLEKFINLIKDEDERCCRSGEEIKPPA